MCLSCTISETASRPAGLTRQVDLGVRMLTLLPALPFLALIMLHRKVFSKLTFPTCRFTPTCSRYALDAVLRYGALRGAWLSTWRVLRCNPIHPGGYDPLT